MYSLVQQFLGLLQQGTADDDNGSGSITSNNILEEEHGTIEKVDLADQ